MSPWLFNAYMDGDLREFNAMGCWEWAEKLLLAYGG